MKSIKNNFTEQEIYDIIEKRIVRNLVLKVLEEALENLGCTSICKGGIIKGRECQAADPTTCNHPNCPGGGGKAYVEKRIAELESGKYPEGTYDINTLTTVNYTSGFQVTFCQIGDDYDNREFTDLVKEFKTHSSDGVVSAGKFGGTPEISFNVTDRETAIELGRYFNQVSVLDWEKAVELLSQGLELSDDCFISTGGTGIR